MRKKFKTSSADWQPRLAAVCAGISCLMAGMLWSGAAAATGLAGLIVDATERDPSVLEARAREEQAAMQTERSRAGHWPVVGVQATGDVQRSSGRDSADPVALIGRVNLFSGGAISAQIRRDQLHQKYYGEKIGETQENLAMLMGEQYLAALRNKELLDTEQRNLQRHDRIIDDLRVIVQHDPGRDYELVQAQARALQVRMRLVQYEKGLRLALSKLSRYTDKDVTLGNPFGPDWRHVVPENSKATNPTILAQQYEMDATREEMENLKRSRWPKIDLMTAVGKDDQYTRVVMNWDFLDRGAYYSQQSAAKQLLAAQSRVDMLNREIDEQTQTAESDMAQSQLQAMAAQQQIGASEKVVELYQMQFRIARRSLLDLLNAYAELASVEVSKITAENDYRRAVLSYLDATASINDWARHSAGAPAVQPQVPPTAQLRPAPAAVPVAMAAVTPASAAEPVEPMQVGAHDEVHPAGTAMPSAHVQPEPPVVVSARDYLGVAEPEPAALAAVEPQPAFQPVQEVQPEPVAEAAPVMAELPQPEVPQAGQPEVTATETVAAETAAAEAITTNNIVSRFDQPEVDGLRTY